MARATSTTDAGAAGGSQDIAKFLKTAQAQWKKTSAKAGKESAQRGYKTLLDGRYITRLSSAEIGYSKGSADKAPRPQIVFGFSVIEGDDTGQVIRRYTGLDAENLDYAAADLARLGLDPEEIDLTKLPELLATLVKEAPVVEIVLKTDTNERGTFQNRYINGLVDGYEDDDDEDDDDDEADEDEDDEDEDEDGELPPPAVGDKVYVELDGKEVEVTVAKVDEAKETFSFKVGRKTHTMAWDDILEDEEEDDTDADDEDEDDEDEPELPAKGDMVRVGVTTGAGKKATTVEHEVKVLKVDDAAGTFTAKVNGKTTTFTADDIIEDEDDEDEGEDEDADNEVDIIPGESRATATIKGKPVTGTIMATHPEDGTVSFKRDDTGKVVKGIPLNDLVPLDDEDEDEDDEEDEPEPTPPTRKPGRPRRK